MFSRQYKKKFLHKYLVIKTKFEYLKKPPQSFEKTEQYEFHAKKVKVWKYFSN